MAITVLPKGNHHAKAQDIADVVNANVKALIDGGTISGTPAHYATSEQQVTLANATDLATSLALVNHIRDVLYGDAANQILGHLNDSLVHKAIDTTNTVTAPKATDLATAITLANEIKADYNAHRSQSGVHATNDGGNATSSANATDQSSLNTLVNEIKTDLNAHMAAASTQTMIRIVSL